MKNVERRIEENSPGYSCAYYQITEIPLIQFMLIDNEEMIILSDQFPYNYAIRHPDLLKLYSDYYEEVWTKATPLKLGPTIMHEEVEKVIANHRQTIVAMESATIHGVQQVKD